MNQSKTRKMQPELTDEQVGVLTYLVAQGWDRDEALAVVTDHRRSLVYASAGFNHAAAELGRTMRKVVTDLVEAMKRA